MKALILRNDANASLATAQALIDKGFQIMSVDTQTVAHALIRVDNVDLLVMDERVGGQLTHAIALSGERRNPYLTTVLLTERTGEETDDLYDLIPSLYALVGDKTTADLLGQLAFSAVTNLEETKARVANNIAAMMADDQQPEEEPTDQADERVKEDILILAQSDMAPVDDDVEKTTEIFADVAGAEPIKEDIVEIAQTVSLERVEDAVSAEVAALFRKNPMPHFMQSHATIPAKAS